MRTVVFTWEGTLSSDRYELFRRLHQMPCLDLVGVIIDPLQKDLSYYQKMRRMQRRRGTVPTIRIAWTKGREAIESRIEREVHVFFNNHRQRTVSSPGFHDLEKLGVPLYFVDDIHSASTLEMITGLAPELGLIFGGKILRESVLRIPSLGTLNIHKRLARKYRGGGDPGYWELKNQEPSTGITIHYATEEVDEGPILAEKEIALEPYETRESIAVKVDVQGPELYLETVESFAHGERTGKPQNLSEDRTYRSPPLYISSRFWKQRKKQLRGSLSYSKKYHGYSLLSKAGKYALYLSRRRKLREMEAEFQMQGNAPITILFYHRIANDAANWLTLPLEAFVEQMEFLRSHYSIIPLHEAVSRLRSGHNEQHAVVVTFDDGYRSNFETCVPYLRYYQIPATFFVSIESILKKDLLEHDRQEGFENAQLFTEDQLRRLCEWGFEIGSHTCCHENCGRLSEARLRHAIQESKTMIERCIGGPVRSFSFPYGKRVQDISKEAYELAIQEYDAVFSAYGGHNFPSRANHRHYLRTANPLFFLDLIVLMNGGSSRDFFGRSINDLEPYQ